MIVREDAGTITVIGQAAHAWLSAQVGGAWGNRRFAAPAAEHREEVLLAALQHDIGMAAWDSRPALDPRGDRPVSFLDMPLQTHLALWSAAPGKLASQSLHAALLVSLHGAALYARRDRAALTEEDRARVDDYLAGQRALQAELIARLGLRPDAVGHHQRLISAWDGLSLAVCLGRAWWSLTDLALTEGGAGSVAVEQISANEFSLDPWPLADKLDTLEVRAEARRLSERFATADELRDALGRAPVEVHRATLVRRRSAVPYPSSP